jgi:L-ascorbate metabolism protein UlaG (beta-lactamase superfamily)
MIGCGSHVDPALLDKFHNKSMDNSQPIAGNNGKLQIQSLGVAGYLITYDGNQLLMAPSFSNPSYLEMLYSVFSGNLAADEAVIKQLLPQNNAEAILVGHAHYDHLLDIPYIMNNLSPNTKAYGSNTMKSLLLSKGVKADRIKSLNDKVSSVQSHDENNWQYVSGRRIRFLALKSDHGPLIGDMMWAPGEYDGETIDSNINALEWYLGEPFAYVIDFLDKDENIEFRIHYVDAASQSKNGFLPIQLQKEKGVDLAILCMAGFDHVTGYPEDIIEHLKPSYIIAGHWEHFFNNQGEQPKVIAATDHEVFIERLTKVMPDKAQWIMPKPMSTLSIELAN